MSKSLLFLLSLSLLSFALASQNTDQALSGKVESLSKMYRLKTQQLNQANLGSSILEKRIDETIQQIDNLELTLKQLDKIADIKEKQGLVAKQQFDVYKKKLSKSNFETMQLDEKLNNLLENYNAVIRNYYIESNAYNTYTIAETNLFNDYSFSEYLQNLMAFETIENSLKLSFLDLDQALEAKKDHQSKVLAATVNLQELKDSFENKVFQAQVAKSSKQRLLDFTKGEQKIYEQLLEESRKNHKKVESKVLDILKTYSEVKNQFFDKGFADYIFFGKNKTFLAWPVDPSLGLTARFQDPAYHGFFGVPHNGLDLRASMGTSIMAPADGVVIQVVGGESTDYHYIMLAHSDGVVTLFGHVFDEYVEKGDKVKKGQVIGMTGGMPGTSGAGFMTTGPHLHFEVFKNGKHIDPLELLDQSQLKSTDLLN